MSLSTKRLYEIDRTVDHGMTGRVSFVDPHGNRVEFFSNICETAEAGLALLRSPERRNAELALDHAAVS